MESKQPSFLFRLLQRAAATAFAGAMTLALFLVLPLMQTIGRPDARSLDFRNVDVTALEPPPPAPPEQEMEEEKPPEAPPELTEQAAPLDLAQLELALNPGMGGGAFGDFNVKLFEQIGTDTGGGQIDEIFSLADLDQRPRVIFQRAPTYPPELRRQNRQGTVYVVFMVDRQGRVQNPTVQKSTDPAFETSALEAVRQWKFEPGTRRGEKVRFKMRVPITFNANG